MTMRKILLIMLLLSTAAVKMSGIAAEVLSEDLNGLTGPAFSDPSRIMEMPETWVKQAVVHEPSFKDADLVVSLDQQMYPAFKPLIEKYALKNRLKIVINMGTCGISSGRLSQKSIDIGGYCCPPGIVDRLPGLTFHTIGIAAIALIVYPENAIDGITLEQAREIFLGDISRWSEIRDPRGKRGANLPIQPVGRLHCKLRAGHWRLLLDNEDLFSPNIIEVGVIPDMITKVSSTLGSIGYETIWMTRRFQDKGKTKSLQINGYSPDNASHLLSGNYPLYRVFNLTTWEGRGLSNPQSRKLVDFLLEEVEHLDGKFGLVPASRLRKYGWKFKGNELVGEPEK